MHKLAYHMLVLASITFALTACGGGGGQQPATQAPASEPAAATTPEPAPQPATAPSIEIAAATPTEAYQTFQKIIEAQDLEAYKAMMSSKLQQRLQGDFLINDAMKSAQSKNWFEKVPMGEPEVSEGTATFSKTHDEGTMMATYSIVFVEEEGVWKFEMLKTSTKAK